MVYSAWPGVLALRSGAVRGTDPGRSGRMVRFLEVAKMNPLHLCWIIPLSFWAGMWAAALFSANGRDDDE